MIDRNEEPASCFGAKKFSFAAARLRQHLTAEEIAGLLEVESHLIRLLGDDKLEIGGWGKRNNLTLRTFFGDLPNDFDTEGSLTLTRWVIDSLVSANLPTYAKAVLLDTRLVEYLDSRFDRRIGASGRLVTDLLGKRSVHAGLRHTAASILCYLALDRFRYQGSAQLQLPFLRNAYTKQIEDPSEVGHPDVIRALCISLARLPDEAEAQTRRLIRDGAAFLWDWITSPLLIPNHFGQPAHLYVRLYSVASISDLGTVDEIAKYTPVLADYREELRKEVEEFCASGTSMDHRVWGFPALLLWSYFCYGDEFVPHTQLISLLRKAVVPLHEYDSGFCLYWAVLVGVLDSITRPEGSLVDLTIGDISRAEESSRPSRTCETSKLPEPSSGSSRT